jgi:hypothetical protein
MKMKDMMQKFSFAQMTSNSDGKTSGSGTLGLFAGFAGILAFLYGTIDYSFMSKDGTIMSQAIIVLTIGAGLLGYRKSKDSGIKADATTTDAAPLNEATSGDETKPTV